MSFLRFRRRRPAALEALIERAVRGEAGEAELRELEHWREASLANEQTYRRTVELLAALRGLEAVRTSAAPPAETLLSERAAAPAGAAPGHRAWRWAAAAVVVVGLGVAAAHFGPAPSGPPRPPEGAGAWGYITGPWEMATVHLPDGSMVRLAPSTRLRFVGSDSAREATLEGRAFFEVAHDPAHPFYVHTRFGEARVLGTRFELTMERGEVRLVVASGRVRLSGRASRVEVAAGEASEVRKGKALHPRHIADPARMDAWVGKYLAFQSTPMPEVLRQISDVYGVRAVATDSVVAARTVTGSFADQDLAHVLDVVCAIVEARCETRGATILVSSR